MWLRVLPLALPAIPIQTGSEKLFFRSCLQQQLTARVRAPLIWLPVPSALFAIGHYVPEDAGENAPAMVLWAGAFGLAAADLAARTGPRARRWGCISRTTFWRSCSSHCPTRHRGWPCLHTR
ncbi:CPBP family intramembrane glutamic endopeptidase [Rhodovulum imhoffii]|uniref:CPBP family intramembrane glutamic endopeptidase n=1 Tax=Rhodovulum imhoffii TaxID=365340 RepID=UPI001F5C9C14|nr:CPBP family intramembrane glutamic endopeptidase [Rhodovulum imhoffii]